MKKQHATTLQRRGAIVRAASGEKIPEHTEHSGDKSSKNKIIISVADIPHVFLQKDLFFVNGE